MSIAIRNQTYGNDIQAFAQDAAEDRRLLTISEMADRFQTTLRTLRFYESRGLLQPIRKGLTRLYDRHAQRRFHLIDEGRKLGFTLTEISEILGDNPTVPALKLTIERIKDQIAHLERQREDVDRALAELRRRYYMMSEPEV